MAIGKQSDVSKRSHVSQVQAPAPQKAGGWHILASPVVQAVPVVALLGALALRHIWENLYFFAVKEDSVVEWLTAVAYLGVVVASAMVCRLAYRRGYRLAAVGYLVLALGAFFIAGEEISWGQRIIGFAGPPELVERNRQGEANLHNLLGRYALHGAYILVSLYGAILARHLVPRIRALRPAFLFVPPAWTATWFGTAAVLYIYLDYVEPVLARISASWPVLEEAGYDRLQEVVELSLSIGFILFVASNLSLLREKALPDRAQQDRAMTA